MSTGKLLIRLVTIVSSCQLLVIAVTAIISKYKFDHPDYRGSNVKFGAISNIDPIVYLRFLVLTLLLAITILIVLGLLKLFTWKQLNNCFWILYYSIQLEGVGTLFYTLLLMLLVGKDQVQMNIVAAIIVTIIIYIFGLIGAYSLICHWNVSLWVVQVFKIFYAIYYASGFIDTSQDYLFTWVFFMLICTIILLVNSLDRVFKPKIERLFDVMYYPLCMWTAIPIGTYKTWIATETNDLPLPCTIELEFPQEIDLSQISSQANGYALNESQDDIEGSLARGSSSTNFGRWHEVELKLSMFQLIAHAFLVGMASTYGYWTVTTSSCIIIIASLTFASFITLKSPILIPETATASTTGTSKWREKVSKLLPISSTLCLSMLFIIWEII